MAAMSSASFEEEVLEGNRSGVVDHFSKGYGFITVDDEGGRERYHRGLFVHHSKLLVPTLRRGDRVKFDVACGNGIRDQAVNVRFADPLHPGAAPGFAGQCSRILRAIQELRDRVPSGPAEAASAPSGAQSGGSSAEQPTPAGRRGRVTDIDPDGDFTIVQCDDPPENIFAESCELKPPLYRLEVGQWIRFEIAEGAACTRVLKSVELAPERPDRAAAEVRTIADQYQSILRAIHELHERLPPDQAPAPTDGNSTSAAPASALPDDTSGRRRGEVTYVDPGASFTIVQCDDPPEYIYAESCDLTPPLDSLEVGHRITFDDEDGSQGMKVLKRVTLTADEPPGSRGAEESILTVVREEFTCGVCHDLISTDSVVTRCGHCFCRRCIEQWIQCRAVCPYCTRKVTSDDLVPIHSAMRNVLERVRASEAN